MARLFLALVAAFAMLAAAPSAVDASEQWCDADPLVLVQTPGGALVPVYVTSGAQGTEHLPAVLLATITYSAAPTADGAGTLVELRVRVPNDLFGSNFPTRSVASTGPLGTLDIYARTTGYSGQDMTMTFALGTP